MRSNFYRVLEAILLLTTPLWSVDALTQDAESYYVENVEAIVQSKCISCHRSGGQAGYTPLRFTSSALSNHNVFDSYVNTPSLGSRANTVLAKIRGAAGHGGGVQVTEGSSEYQRFTQYMDLLSEVAEPTPSVPSEPLNVSAAAGNASATVSFSVPADDGGATITSYTATSNPGALSGSCTASPCLVEGISNGTAYTFTVSATNEAGEGPDSDSSNAVTPNAPEVDNDLSPPSLTAFLNLFSSVQSFLNTNSKATSSRAPASRHVDDHRKEPQEIPTIPMLNIIILSGLLGLFGIRRFAYR